MPLPLEVPGIRQLDEIEKALWLPVVAVQEKLGMRGCEREVHGVHRCVGVRHGAEIADPGRERREGVERYQPAGGILPPAARAERRSVTRHPVVDLHHRAAQRPEPAEHGGDALEVKRRGKSVYRALAGVGSHGCQFFSQEAPVGGKGLDGVRPGAEPWEVGARRVQVSLENVAISAAGYGPGSFGRHRLERNWLAGPVKSA